MSSAGAFIQAIRTHLPAQRLTNEELASEFKDWGVTKIYSKTGIASRAIAADGECASDLGVAAARKLFVDGVIEPSQIDYLIFCTQSPDYYLPATACLVQHQLGLPVSCAALDINQGCSGFVYGLSLAKGLIESGISRNVLLITADTYSKHINHGDRSVRTIFGDGAAATLIAADPAKAEALGPFVLGTDGSGAKELIVPAGGLRRPVDETAGVETKDASGSVRSPRNLYMNGGEIFTFTLKAVPALVTSALTKAGLSMDQVDYFVFHQANRYMLEQIRKKIGIPAEKFCINMENYGNTVSASIPMALELAAAQGAIKSGDRLLLAGFGVGYSWGACMIEWTAR